MRNLLKLPKELGSYDRFEHRLRDNSVNDCKLPNDYGILFI